MKIYLKINGGKILKKIRAKLGRLGLSHSARESKPLIRKLIRKVKRHINFFALYFLLIFLASAQLVQAFPFLPKKGPGSVEVPIIMYHLITKNSKYQGKYGISIAEMENDLAYLRENGYETVIMSDLIEFVYSGRALPEKPVMLTFDDGYSSDLRYLLPLLAKYKMKAVTSIVGKYVEESVSDSNGTINPYLTWAQIKELHDSGLVEIQNHSFDLHGRHGSGKRGGELAEAYQARLSADLAKCQESVKKNIGVTPTAYTYPLGIISKGSKAVLVSLGFKASLSCSEGMNIIEENNPDCLFSLRRNIRKSGSPLSRVLGSI
ncbi:MAG: polysaccharide deacetylase family protein [Clostridiales bacterium]|nr:polysaccharide deacetylase family protein [Clostridiales bacterium]